MTYEIRLRPAVQSWLDGLADRDYRTVERAFAALEVDPTLSRVQQLADSGLWRVRVSQHRLVCAIDDDDRLITVLAAFTNSDGTPSL